MHIAAIRKALGDRRHVLSTSAGHGYRLVGVWEWRLRESDPAGAQRDAEARARTNLPASLAPLIGREADITKLEALIADERLVTLAGTGGIGKTSLAREIARRALSTWDGEIWFVDLAPLSEGRSVFAAIASTLNLDLSGLAPSATSVSRAIGSRRLYLVLDNCEHVIDASAEIAEAINRACRFTKVVATSREVLRAEQEHVFLVPPLDLPREEEQDLDEIMRCGAVALFVTRAGALNAAFSHGGDEAPIIVEICRQLDGIPLAIEIAAARAAIAGCAEVASRLIGSLRSMSGGRRTALPRHQTLQATLEWSFSLLSGVEQATLRRLSIFAGVLQPRVRRAGGRRQSRRSTTCEGSLVFADLEVARHICRRSDRAGPPTSRDHASFRAEHVESSGEFDSVARRHADFVRDQLERADADAVVSTQAQWLERYRPHLDDLRAALRWSLGREKETELGATLVASAIPLWNSLSLLVESQEWIGAAVAKLGPDWTETARGR